MFAIAEAKNGGPRSGGMTIGGVSRVEKGAAPGPEHLEEYGSIENGKK
jgi:hypothetical protein